MQNHISQPMSTRSQPLPPMSSQRMALTIWGATDVGREREGNEDSIFPRSDGGDYQYNLKPETLNTHGQLLIVADGVGGAQAGRASSQWAIQRAVENYYEQQPGDSGAMLQNAIGYANASLYRYLQETRIQTAGCTMAAAVIHNNTLYVANVGDSRVYLIRDGKAYQQTRDHTLTQQKIDQHILTPEQAENDPDKSVLTRSMGHGPTVQVDRFQPVPLIEGDLVLVCSDGLYDLVPDAEMARMATSAAPQKAAAKLIAAANRNGGFDNISVILAQVGGRASGGGGMPLLKSFSFNQQKVLIGLLVALVVVVLALGGVIGWSLYGKGKDGGDPTSTPPATAAPSAPTPATSLEVVSTQPSQPTPENKTSEVKTTSDGLATSTPKPTSTYTPTPTRKPPTAIPTLTPELPTPTFTPEGGGGNGGGGGTNPPSPIPTPACLGEATRCETGQAVCENGSWVCR